MLCADPVIGMDALSVAELDIVAGFVASIVIGLCLGSFATLLAWRLPRDLPVAYSSKSKKTTTAQDPENHEQDGVERSRCPSCGATLNWRDLVPLFSWLLQKGKCRHCGAAIPVVYPLIELCKASKKLWGRRGFISLSILKVC